MLLWAQEKAGQEKEQKGHFPGSLHGLSAWDPAAPGQVPQTPELSLDPHFA